MRSLPEFFQHRNKKKQTKKIRPRICEMRGTGALILQMRGHKYLAFVAIEEKGRFEPRIREVKMDPNSNF